MKNFTPVTVLVALILFSFTAFTSCKKDAPEGNLPIEKTVGKWVINRIQIKVYYGDILYKDSIRPYTPGRYFFTELAANKSFQFSFDSNTIDTGAYDYKGTDSIVAITPSNVYKWKMLTLIDKLFTARSINTTDPAFPGARVETYYTFIR